jgi:simple sugar transport system substrate-binding protein
MLMILFLLALQAAAAPQATYYVIPHSGPGDPFWAVMHKGFMEVGQKLGVRVLFSAPDEPGNIAKQVSLMQAAIAANPAGIALTVTDRKAFSKPIQEARKKGITVVAFDTREDPRDKADLPYQAYIGADEYQSGRKVAERALEYLPPKSKVLVATHQPGHMGFELRTKGISDVLKPKGFIIEKLDITQSSTKAIAVFSSYFKRTADVKGVFVMGPLGAVAIGKFLTENTQKWNLFVSSFDMDDVTLKYIKNGLITVTLDAMPYMQAFMLITQMHLAHEFALTPVDIDTGGGFVTKDNVAQVEELVKKGYR